MRLKTGITAMTLALVFAGMVAVFALLDGSAEPAAAVKSAAKQATEPLVRSDPGVEPRKEERAALPTTEAEKSEPERRPALDPAPQPAPQPEPKLEPGPQPEPELKPQPEPPPVRT